MNAISPIKPFAELVVDHEDGTPWSEVDAETRKDQLAKIFVERQIEHDIFEVLKHIGADADRYTEVRNGAIIGESGVGKTDIAKRFLAANPEQIDPKTGNIIRPVLYVDVRNSSTPKAVAQAMLRALLRRRDIEEDIAIDDPLLAEFLGKDISKEDPEAKESYVFGGTSELSYRVKKQMIAQGVRIAILDEFHNTVTDNGAVRLNRIAEWVKDFAKAKERSARRPDGKAAENVAIVMIGTNKVEKILNAKGNQELSRITPYREKIGRYKYKTLEQKQAFRQFLDDLDTQLPFDEDSKLGDPALADKIHVVTGGLLRPLGQIITKAAELAIDANAPLIEEHHLYRAVELMRGVLESGDPEDTGDKDTKEKRVKVMNVFKAPVLEPRTKKRERSKYTG